MTPERLATIKASLDKRQTDLTVVMENVRKPHNLAAVARTLEAVGGLEIHAITELTSIRLVTFEDTSACFFYCPVILCIDQLHF